MSEPLPGPGAVPDEAAAIVDEAMAVPKTTPLTPEERAVLVGLIAARTAVMEQIEGYLTGTVSARLGIHRNRIAGADIKTGLITLASDAPKEVPPA